MAGKSINVVCLYKHFRVDNVSQFVLFEFPPYGKSTFSTSAAGLSATISFRKGLRSACC